ncbi:MAG: single-stranded DNA-binding protein [Parachlamydiales bacterium]|nr:single-stranded DNA-binding protein [Parachlamydiales bacterium]
MNTVFIAGHLGADPEVRFTSGGQKVSTLRVAARSRRGGSEDTIWWRVTVWGDQFDKMMTYFKKGSPIVVIGDLQKPEIFTNKGGQPQVSLNVTAVNLMFSPFGRSDRSSQSSEVSADEESMVGMVSGSQPENPEISLGDDEIPF